MQTELLQSLLELSPAPMQALFIKSFGKELCIRPVGSPGAASHRSNTDRDKVKVCSLPVLKSSEGRACGCFLSVTLSSLAKSACLLCALTLRHFAHC